MKSELHYWLALLRTNGIGCTRGRALLQAFPNITDLFTAPISAITNLGIPTEVANNLKNPPWSLIDKDLEWLSQPQNHLITFQDANYPKLLQETSGAPLALFVVGNPSILNNQQIAVVGSRQPSHTGLDHAHDFANQLALLGITITSGLAAGIDAESHKGALRAQGKTIAVVGTGVDKIYPLSNKALKNQIIEQGGAVVSEFPLGTNAKAENFPQRNRIISGLSLGVLVVEATMRSGSLITARLATEQGREVFAIPGSINNPLARGCHILIRQGAKLVENINDILEDLPSLTTKIKSLPMPNTFSNSDKSINSKNEGYKENLDNFQQKLLQYIDYDPTPIDILVERSGLSAQNISSQLLLLELQGHIKAIYGGYVRLKK